MGDMAKVSSKRVIMYIIMMQPHCVLKAEWDLHVMCT